MDKKKDIRVYLDEEPKKQLKELAESKNMTLSAFISDTMEKVYAINYLDYEIMNVKRYSEKLSEKIDELKAKMEKIN